MVSSAQCRVTGPYREEEGEENRKRDTRTHHLEAGFIRVRPSLVVELTKSQLSLFAEMFIFSDRNICQQTS